MLAWLLHTKVVPQVPGEDPPEPADVVRFQPRNVPLTLPVPVTLDRYTDTQAGDPDSLKYAQSVAVLGFTPGPEDAELELPSTILPVNAAQVKVEAAGAESTSMDKAENPVLEYWRIQSVQPVVLLYPAAGYLEVAVNENDREQSG